MHLISKLALLVGALALAISGAGCTASDSGPPAARSQRPAQPAALADNKDPKSPVSVPALQSVLEVFLSDAGDRWATYGPLQGVEWTESTPSAYAEGRYSRSGVMTLLGFSMKAVPNGKEGFEAGVVQRNEGRSGITLDGDENKVQSFAVKKFYPETDYLRVLRRQFTEQAKIVAISKGCDADPDEESFDDVFFRIELGGRHVFVNAFGEDAGKSGPGYTVFDFTRKQPVERMRELNCR